MVYNTLHKMLGLLGYQGEVTLFPNDDDDEAPKFSLDKLVLKELLEGKDPQIIRHLLVYAAENP